MALGTRDQRVRKSRPQFWDTRPCAQDTPKAQATWAGDNLTQAESQEMNVFGIEAKAEWVSVQLRVTRVGCGQGGGTRGRGRTGSSTI